MGGHEGDEEEGSHEAPRHEGCCRTSSAQEEGHEGHEGHEEEGSHESHGSDEGHEGHEGKEVSHLPTVLEYRNWRASGHEGHGSHEGFEINVPALSMNDEH